MLIFCWGVNAYFKNLSYSLAQTRSLALRARALAATSAALAVTGRRVKTVTRLVAPQPQVKRPAGQMQ